MRDSFNRHSVMTRRGNCVITSQKPCYDWKSLFHMSVHCFTAINLPILWHSPSFSVKHHRCRWPWSWNLSAGNSQSHPSLGEPSCLSVFHSLPHLWEPSLTVLKHISCHPFEKLSGQDIRVGVRVAFTVVEHGKYGCWRAVVASANIVMHTHFPYQNRRMSRHKSRTFKSHSQNFLYLSLSLPHQGKKRRESLKHNHYIIFLRVIIESNHHHHTDAYIYTYMNTYTYLRLPWMRLPVDYEFT